MSKFQFQKATKSKRKARIALCGVSGSGKTMSGLAILSGLASKIAVIDTENGSASLYSDLFPFDVLELASYEPENYVEAIHAAEEAGYEGLLIDSLSHAWMGKGGALEQVEQKRVQSQSKNSFDAWRHVTPKHNAFVDALVHCKCHLIVTMRSKAEYVVEENDKGKRVPRKIGMAPIQRDGLEYEFDVVGDIDLEHNWIITKTRCPLLVDKVINRPGKDVAGVLRGWLDDGAAPAERPFARIRKALETVETDEQLGKIREQANGLRQAGQFNAEEIEQLASLGQAARARISATVAA